MSSLKGNSKLIINRKTMIEAITYWLHGRLLLGDSPNVIDVKEKRNGDFLIKMQDQIKK